MSRPLLAMAAALLALSSTPAAAQSVEAGVLLSAARQVTDFRFERSVVFVMHHDEEGSLGIIVNRPTRLKAAETFDALGGLEGYTGRVFVGGPIDPTRPLQLVNDAGGALTDSDPVFDSIHLAVSPDVMRRHAERLGAADEATLRIYAGHLQWEPGQLEREVANGTWRVVPGSARHVFTSEPLELYRRLGAGEAGLVAAGAR